MKPKRLEMDFRSLYIFTSYYRNNNLLTMNRRKYMLILVLVFVLIKKNLKLKKEMENLKLLLKLTEDDFDEYFNKYWELKNKQET